MSRRERRSVSLGRHRDRPPRDHSKAPDDDLSTRHNISNFLLTLQRVQAAEEENRQLRKENQLLRQRTRSSRLSSASFKGQNSFDESDQTTILPDAEDEIIAADVKRNSLMFVGDAIPPSPEHAALETQYKKLQEDFETVKEFLKHLFQHALTMSSSSSSSSDGKSPSSSSSTSSTLKDKRSREKVKVHSDVNTYNPSHSKQLEHSLEDIHGQISQLRNSQDQQQVKMEQVQQALDNVLCQSSVRNDVTMRMMRQQDKLKEITQHANFLETQLTAMTISFRLAEEKLWQAATLSQSLESFTSTNQKNLKGNTKDELYKMAEHLKQISKRSTSTCLCKMATVKNLVSHVITAASKSQSFIDSKPPADVVDAMSKLERLVGSDWHRLGRMIGLSSDCLDDIGKFTNFDLTSKVEKVMISWAKLTRGASAELLQQGMDKMDRDILLIAEQPVSKEWFQPPPDVTTYVIAHTLDVPSIVCYLATQGFLSQDSRAFILGATHEHRRAGRLLQTAVYMGRQVMCALCASLDSYSQGHVANKIRASLPTTYLHSETPPDKNNKIVTPNSSDQSASISIQKPPTSKDSNKTPSKASTPKTGEKQRKKRSRSLFTRKNKLRDSEPDVDLAVDLQSEYNYNYYYPSINLNAVHAGSSASNRSGSGSSDGTLQKDAEASTFCRRQFGLRNHQAHMSNSSDEVTV